MDLIKYQKAMLSYYTEDVLRAIKKQDELLSDLHNKQEVYESLKSKITDLYISGFAKLKEINIKNPFDIDGKSRFEIGFDVIQSYLSNNEDYNKYSSAINQIPDLKKVGDFEKRMPNALLDFYKSFKAYHDCVLEDRITILTKQYQNRIDELSKSGWFFSYLASPDLPLLHDFCDEHYLCDFFIHSDCSYIRILLSPFLNQENPSNSMRRKIQDLDDVIYLISHNGYRSAARNLFALLESESKNCSNVFRKLRFLKDNLRTGKERSDEIQKIVKSINVDWYVSTLKTIDAYYMKSTAKEITPSIINRNILIHGDYFQNYMDVSLSDTLKLLLLFVNYRMVSDFVQYVVELEADIAQYTMIGIAQMIRKENGNQGS